MVKMVLLHGYGSGARYAIIKNHPADLQFSGFADQLKNEHAKHFIWFHQKEFSFFQSLNPFHHLNLYLAEKKLAQHTEVLTKLETFIKKEQPEIIVCHSMGSLLLANLLRNTPLPKSVKKIVLIQADISADATINTTIPITNIYCPWDPSLWFSVFINKYLPAGLVGLKATKQNLFFPLLTGPNLHLSSIKSKELAKKIEQNLI